MGGEVRKSVIVLLSDVTAKAELERRGARLVIDNPFIVRGPPSQATAHLPSDLVAVQLPRILRDDSLEVLKAAGFIFLQEERFCRDEADFASRKPPVMGDVVIPADWKITPLPLGGLHSNYADLMDGRGRPRATIFYKRATHDECADLGTCTYFSIKDLSRAPADPRPAYAVLDGHGRRVFVSKEYSVLSKEAGEEARSKGGESYSAFLAQVGIAQKAVFEECEAWLNANRPDWRDKTAYWDVEI